MGIFSSLLTGGALLGKVCQSLSGVFSEENVFKDGDVTYSGGVKIGGGQFVRVDGGEGKEGVPYLFNNSSSLPLSFAYQDYDGNSFEQIIRPTEKLNVSSHISDKNSPDTQIIVGPISNGTNLNDVSDSGQLDPSMKVSFSGLPLDGTKVHKVGFGFRATTTSGITVETGPEELTGLAYYNIESSRGVRLESMGAVLPQSTLPGTYTFPIDFSNLGFIDTDVLSCRLFFAVSPSNVQAKIEKSESVPMTEFEKKIFVNL
ncbi:MAG: hypothetical protein LBI63_02065 [Candidatus Ancillula sp.]|jgi:hypothetical protein|nr:hypothetical protein [Candidatus Ancillula sp.]